MEKYKRFAFDVGLAFVGSTSTIVLGFVVSVLLGRYLGPDELGLYKTVSVLYGMALLVASLGVPATVTKIVAEQKDNFRRVSSVTSAGITLSVILGSFFALAFLVSSGSIQNLFVMDGLASLLVVLAPVFPFALVNGILMGFLNGIREMKKFALATILQGVIMLLLSAYMILEGYGVRGVVLSIVISSVITLIYLCWACKGFFAFELEKFSRTAGEMLPFGVRVFAANAVNIVNYQGDLLLVGYFLTTADVGFYGVAIGLGRFFWVIPQAVQTVTFPAISEHWGKGDAVSVEKIVEKSTKFTALAIVPIGLTIGFFGTQIIELIFGSGFDDSVILLQIVLVGTVVNGVMQRPIGSMLYSMGLPGLNLRIFSSTAVVNVALCLYLIPTIGVIGAAIARSVSFIMITVLILVYIQKAAGAKVDYLWFTKLWFATIVCILAHFCLIELGLGMVSFALVIGLTVLIWYRFLKNDDRERVISLMRHASRRVRSIR